MSREACRNQAALLLFVLCLKVERVPWRRIVLVLDPVYVANVDVYVALDYEQLSPRLDAPYLKLMVLASDC